MNAKLTLELDENLIRRAQAHAQARGKSLSQIVEEALLVFEQSAPPPTAQPPTSSAAGPEDEAASAEPRRPLPDLPVTPELREAVRRLYKPDGTLDESKLSPEIKRLRGALAGSKLDERDYYEYLARKHS